jgi:hypothetical protein
MKLKIEKLQEVAFYPDVEGNLALPENERFTIHLKKQSAFRLMDCYTSIDGTDAHRQRCIYTNDRTRDRQSTDLAIRQNRTGSDNRGHRNIARTC